MLPTLSPTGDLVLHVRLPFLRFLELLPGASQELRERFPTRVPGMPNAKVDPSAGLGLRLGDMVVALSPSDSSRTVCKRILGMPGDIILVDPRDAAGGVTDAAFSHDEHTSSLTSTLLRLHGLRTVTVPPGHVWLTGDNLANSTDSRHYGPVPLAMVKGRVVARVLPRPTWFSKALHPVP